LNDDCPCVLVLERIASAGWRKGRQKTKQHTKEDTTKKFYFIAGKFPKPYFQCLLQLESILTNPGGPDVEVHLDQPLDYYRCLLQLKDRAAVKPNCGAKFYKESLKTGKVLPRDTASGGQQALAPLELVESEADSEVILMDASDEEDPVSFASALAQPVRRAVAPSSAADAPPSAAPVVVKEARRACSAFS
jgi:hypothetical protein